METKPLSFNALIEILRKASAIRFTFTPPSPERKGNVAIHHVFVYKGEDGFAFDFLDSEYNFLEDKKSPFLEVVNDSILVKSLDGVDFYIKPLFSRTMEDLLKECK